MKHPRVLRLAGGVLLGLLFAVLSGCAKGAFAQEIPQGIPQETASEVPQEVPQSIPEAPPAPNPPAQDQTSPPSSRTTQESTPPPDPGVPPEPSEQSPPLSMPGTPSATDDPYAALLPAPPSWSFKPDAAPAWQPLGTGLELGRFPGQTGLGRKIEMVILRINPDEYAFSVHTVTSAGEARSLGAWADLHGLVAVINASMYLPDGFTSTGYLRAGEVTNNARIVKRFGAFFVADPDTPDLPSAALIDRSEEKWEEALPHYRYAVQNYRLISAGRRLLWQPGGPSHSIAAIGRDGNGRILFIHCRETLTGVDFGNLLLALPFDIRLVMYAEGGSQAGLLVRTPELTQTWMGSHPVELLWMSGNADAPLPSVIGIRKK